MPPSPPSARIALVTGSGIRVGRAIALCLAEAGADIAVHYNRSKAPAEAVCRQVEAMGRRAQAFHSDLGTASGCRNLMRQVVSSLGGLDWLVHSASVFHRKPLAETTEQIWDDSLAVNARAGFLLAREAAPSLSRRGGRIVFISDLMARQPPRNYSAHAVSKSAVEGLVRALAVELAPEVSVNGVAPGAVLVPEGTTPEEAAHYAKRVPLGRIGEPEDVARTVLFFCTGPSFITGQILAVDGGQTLV
jgi:NAD(P)-dependent dehydrogenase (short-subunit alcohol dehydrogenase family)